MWLSWLALFLGPAAAAPVVETLPEGRIDWSRMVLVVAVQSDQRVGAWTDRRLQEQDAMDRLGPQVRGTAMRVRLTPDTQVTDIVGEEGPMARRISEGADAWVVTEARYREAGSVELVAELDLHRWLKPVLATLARPEPVEEGPGEFSGLLVDVRGLPFEPCLVPRVLSASGELLFGVQRLYAGVLDAGPPVVYVSDPADPRAVARAGERPLLVRAASVARGGEIQLDPEVGQRVQAAADLPSLASRGRVVIVVGP